MKIVVFCEGSTEAALRNGLRQFLQEKCAASARTGITTRSLDGSMLQKKLRRLVELTLAKPDVVGAVALTDVYPHFPSAEQAKAGLRKAAGPAAREPRFRAHAAQFELEAWVLPFWDEIADALRVKAASPGARPEEVDGEHPPSHRLKELYVRAGQRYDKVLDGPKWLTADRLESAAEHCPELRAFLKSLIELAGAAFP